MSEHMEALEAQCEAFVGQVKADLAQCALLQSSAQCDMVRAAWWKGVDCGLAQCEAMAYARVATIEGSVDGSQ